MSGEYHCTIEKTSEGYQFVIYPGNNANQRIGQSKYCDDENSCVKMLSDFAAFITENSIEHYIEPFTKIEEINGHYFLRYLKDGEVLFSTRGYEHKQSAKDIISGIYKNIDVCKHLT